MIRWVQKRDGRIVPFHAEKIADAIFAAARAVGGEDRRQAEVLAGQVIHLLQQETLAGSVPQVEEIQDLVEKVLIEEGHARTAKAFILYRNRRTRIREAKSELMDVVSEVLQESGSDVQPATSPFSKLHRIAIAASERYTLNNLLPPEFSLAHQRAAIHIHQLAYYATSLPAASLELPPLMETECWGKQAFLPQPVLQDISHFSKVLLALISMAQSEAFGELLLADADSAFAALCQRFQIVPTAREVEQLAQELLIDLNLIWISGGSQTAKICISVGLDTTACGQLFTQSLLHALQEGYCMGLTPTLPQVIYQLQEGVNVGATDRGYGLTRLAMEVAELRGNPSFVRLAPEDTVKTSYLASGTRLSGSSVLVSKTFVNMPRLALEAGSEPELWSNIDASFSLVAKQMVHHYEVQKALQSRELPFLLQQLASPQLADSHAALLSRGLLLIVPVGIKEALQVARLRFSNLNMTDAQFVTLLLEISEHWRKYYAVNIQVGLAPSTAVARRFYEYDRSVFPLVNTLWPTIEGYSSAQGLCSIPFLPGGRWEVCSSCVAKEDGVVYTFPYYEKRCLSCGQQQERQATACSVCECQRLLEVQLQDGYLAEICQEGQA